MPTQGWVYRVVLALSGITLVLVVVYLVVTGQNRRVQAEINQRQQFINQSIQLGRINEALIRALAAAAVNDKDDKLRDLLVQSGIAISQKSGQKSGAPASAATQPPAAEKKP